MVNEATRQSWRDIILYGRNTATYKFALGRSLLELGAQGKDFVTLEDLAVPFGRHMVDHVQDVPRQAVTASSRYVALCRHYAEGRIPIEELHSATLLLGLRYVIDAFPRVDVQHAQPVDFYIDERKAQARGLRLTDPLLELATTTAGEDLSAETDARWQLVERAWESKYGTGDTLLLAYEEPTESLIPALLGKRRPFRTSVRPALNGYQRGHCFYCYRQISVFADGEDGSHVDHFLPFVSVVRGAYLDVEGVWNLVLACKSCNGAKWDRLPAEKYLAQLGARNTWLVESNHPLRETVMNACGSSASDRRRFLKDSYELVGQVAKGPWQAEPGAPFPFSEHMSA